jgi:hypothetical protein
MNLFEQETEYDRGPAPSEAAVKKAAASLPPIPLKRFKMFMREAAVVDSMLDSFANDRFHDLKRLRDLKDRRDRADNASDREEVEESIDELQKEMADKDMARDASRPKRVNTDLLSRLVVATYRDKTPTRYFVPDLPEQSPEADSELLDHIGENIGAKKAELAVGHFAYCSVADIMARLDSTYLNKFCAAGAPDFREFVREKLQRDGSYRAGPAHWPRAYAGVDSFVADGFHFLFWCFRDEIRKRLEKEIKRLTVGKEIIPAAERIARREKLAKALLHDERVEEALITRLAAAGRTVTRRHDANPLALLMIKTGKRK